MRHNESSRLAPDLLSVYQSVVLAHNRAPHGKGRLAVADYRCSGANPLCGDALEVALLRGADGVITAAAFDGEASALTTAVASILMRVLPGKHVGAACTMLTTLLERFEQGHIPAVNLDSAQLAAAFQASEGLQEIDLLAPLAGLPNRRKALTLPIATCLAALQGRASASTENAPDDHSFAPGTKGRE